MGRTDHDRGSGDGRVFRFAPSPNGLLHLGHALSALLNRDIARAEGGRLLLRLEDIDRERCREAFATAIVDDLRWLDVAWTGTPRRQSEHFAAYRSALDALAARRLVFPCFCTRGAVLAASAAKAAATGVPRPTDPDGAPLYVGTCRQLSSAERARRIAEGRPAALRLDMAAALEAVGAEGRRSLRWRECGDGAGERDVPAEPAAWGDAMLARRDVPTSYHVSVVVDDALQGVTDVVRGRDLFHATGLHRLLQTLLGFPAPRYHHHRLVLDAGGHKLSKSRGAPSLRDLRREGLSPADIRRLVGLGG
ncbi:tRNA glutamyl-Q(34) synthetase GluQRS [Lichenibacterium ramalinae]|uniref:tRNA glutamyl-Q(34) synthetase GluQRS n=1 Tax=Lichenibacterium ramalinae TaxID=2316527 RepID=A0A4Q2R7T1_9HYPH|nr:tRNA glutamyl-Q(34) synthetase GluQRS [Lichenibacterium ramalinae]RYB01480.1 tRNA glutamyl-Q(34) synthetase GluQRS [Lichenibacterium ramalinae]